MDAMAVTSGEFSRRVEDVQRAMAREGLDLLIVAGDEHYQGHVRYLSDYRPMLEYAIVLVRKTGDPILLCGPECKALAFQRSRITDIRVCSDVAIPGEEYPNEEMLTLRGILSEVEGDAAISQVGVINLDLMPYFLVRPVLELCHGKRVVNATHLLDGLRAVKSGSEIRLLRQTYAMGQAGLREGIKALAIGKRETDVVAEMAYPLYRMGAEQMSHCFYAGSGRNSIPALNFSQADKVIDDGDLVVLDIGPVFHGYYADIATSRIVGTRSEEKLRVLETAIEALEAAVRAVKPGVAGKEIDLAARRITSEAGYAKHHLYGAVHGVGLQHCEAPFFGPNSEELVQPSMFFNIDIGLFDFQFGGVRVENGILVTEDGCEVFAASHRDEVIQG